MFQATPFLPSVPWTVIEEGKREKFDKLSRNLVFFFFFYDVILNRQWATDQTLSDTDSFIRESLPSFPLISLSPPPSFSINRTRRPYPRMFNYEMFQY